MTAPVKWWQGRMGAFDTETTAPDPHDARIVTAACVYTQPDGPARFVSWLIDPLIDVPTEAADVHGWTTERIRERLNGEQALRNLNGTVRSIPRDAALLEIAQRCGSIMGAEIPLVVMNAPYDTTVLDHELARTGAAPAVWKGIVDPSVIEKAFDPYRKVKGGCTRGKWACGGCGAENKTLTGLCQHYGITLNDAHGSAADALASAQLAARLGEAWPAIGRLRLPTLHAQEVDWRAAQMDSLRSYFEKNDIDHDGCCRSWPTHVDDCCAVWPAFRATTSSGTNPSMEGTPA